MFLTESFYGYELSYNDIESLGGPEFLKSACEVHDLQFIPFLVKDESCFAMCVEYYVAEFDYSYYNYEGLDSLSYFTKRFNQMKKFSLDINLKEYYSSFLEGVQEHLTNPSRFIYATQEYTLRQYMLLEENRKYMNCNHS